MSTPTHPAIAALSAAIEDAASLLRVPAESITVKALEAREWPDSCLGVPAEGEGCAEAITPGYRIWLGDGFVYHADQRGNVRRNRGRAPLPDTEIRLRYTISGGIGGWHSSFETDSDKLTDAEETGLRRLITQADFFNAPNALPTSPVNDGITTSLWIAVGRRSHEVIRGDGIEVEDSAGLRALMAWAAERTPPLFPRQPS